MTDLRIDSVDPAALTGIGARSSRGTGDDMWASTSRPQASDVQEVLEIDLGSRRLVNLLTFEASRFPCVITGEWYDGETWSPLSHVLEENTVSSSMATRRVLPVAPVRMTIADSVPKTVGLNRDLPHPQHFGSSHWVAETWKVVPVRAVKIRFVIQRHLNGEGPTTMAGLPADYSVAMRRVRVGYRVASDRDIPVSRTVEGEDFEASRDLLGSRVTHSIYRQGAFKAIDGNRKTAWRSEPQPINYAVVPFYIDMRTSDGDGQVIDKFFVDPTTPGVHCNLYYSNEDPVGDFLGGNAPIPTEFLTEVGVAKAINDAKAEVEKPTMIEFPSAEQAGAEVSNVFTRLDYTGDWWIGIDADALVPSTDNQIRPIISLGATRIYQQSGLIHLANQAGDEAWIQLPPEHVEGVRYRLVISNHKATARRPAYVRLRYVAIGYSVDAQVEKTMTLTPEGAIRIGLHPDPESDLTAAMRIRGLVIKAQSLNDDDTEDWFGEEGEAYVRDDQTFPQAQRNTHLNAVLRLHPAFYKTGVNSFGLVGGDGDRISQAVWTPVGRDFILSKGFLTFPPVKARYWKMEFTQLAPRLLENPFSFDRNVLCFPPNVVATSNAVGPQTTRTYMPHGTSAMVDNIEAAATMYADAISALRSSGATPDATKALVVSDPTQADQASELGWIWQYQPWHSGSISPRWSQPGKHFYEIISVRHRSKVAYFVGIREVVPYVTEHGAEDDTEEYVERFQSTNNIDEIKATVLTADGMIAQTSSAEITSTTMKSYLKVRGVQFATMQTGSVQVLTDPDFLSEGDAFYDYYQAYGDATLDRIEDNRVLVKRGASEGGGSGGGGDAGGYTYGEMEAYTYGELEGLVTYGGGDSAVPQAYSEGGIVCTEYYKPMGAGEVTARVKVSSEKTLVVPVTVEILSAPAYGAKVLAAAESEVAAGSPVDIVATFTPDSLVGDGRTYGELEGLSEEIGDVPDGPPDTDVGPGSTSSASRTYMGEHQTSSTPDFPGGSAKLYYRFDPASSGVISFDTHLSTGTTAIAVTAGSANVSPMNDSNGHGGFTAQVTAGTTLEFEVTSTGVADVLLRSTSIGDTTLWDPNAIEPTGAAKYDVGPGTYSGAGTAIQPHKIGITDYTYVAGAPVVLPTYRFLPSQSGRMSMDVLLSEPIGDEVEGWFVNVFAASGASNVQQTNIDGKVQTLFDATAGQEVVIRVSAAALNSSGLVPAPTKIILRLSDENSTTLWDPGIAAGDGVEGDTTWGFLERFTYGELEEAEGDETGTVTVRVRQKGASSEEFTVHRIALYDDPIAWSFSVDDGNTWHRAPGVRNEPKGVLMFPEAGSDLRWKAQIAKADATITALHIRPWYGSKRAPADYAHDLEYKGSSVSSWDNLPSLPQHPMWKIKNIPVEFVFEPPKPLEPFWRNLVPNPSGEGSYREQWKVSGGIVRARYFPGVEPGLGGGND